MSELIDARQQEPEEAGSTEIIRLIGASRERAMQAVNTAPIDLYRQIGEIISRRVAAAKWGEGAVETSMSLLALGHKSATEETQRHWQVALPSRSISREIEVAVFR